MDLDELRLNAERLQRYCRENHSGDAILAAYVERIALSVTPKPVMIAGPEMTNQRVVQILRDWD